jgi:hypothetical protein
MAAAFYALPTSGPGSSLTSRKTLLQFVKFAWGGLLLQVRRTRICFTCWTERCAGRGPCSPVRHQTLLRKKWRARIGDEGKAAGCVPLAALLFEQALNTRSVEPNSQSA